jgi:hypothetical protein
VRRALSVVVSDYPEHACFSPLLNLRNTRPTKTVYSSKNPCNHIRILYSFAFTDSCSDALASVLGTTSPVLLPLPKKMTWTVKSSLENQSVFMIPNYMP